MMVPAVITFCTAAGGDILTERSFVFVSSTYITTRPSPSLVSATKIDRKVLIFQLLQNVAVLYLRVRGPDCCAELLQFLDMHYLRY